MAKLYERIDPALASWIMRQPMFFVGTAPGGDGGHINVSPKGPMGTLRLLDDHTLAYLDLVGSGADLRPGPGPELQGAAHGLGRS